MIFCDQGHYEFCTMRKKKCKLQLLIIIHSRTKSMSKDLGTKVSSYYLKMNLLFTSVSFFMTNCFPFEIVYGDSPKGKTEFKPRHHILMSMLISNNY